MRKINREINRNRPHSSRAFVGSRYKCSRKVQCSILGAKDKKSPLPLVFSAALPKVLLVNPVEAVEDLCRRLAPGGEREIRMMLDLPSGPRLVEESPLSRELSECTDPWEVLLHAFVLGLSGENIYDPKRPLIWTQRSLRRQVHLYAGDRFYK
ncbi:MAG: hypothetical protein QF492_09370 [Candidatus Krumholzibacteria bacterium]|nr:hypothetical protein [Candidatus Krumholzibacteria bacterium]